MGRTQPADHESASAPLFIHISDGKLHDVNVLDMLAFEAGAFHLMDRGYKVVEVDEGHAQRLGVALGQGQHRRALARASRRQINTGIPG